MARTRCLGIEPLEDRTTPSTYGVPWPDALHLTLSFVPDGTRAGPASSNLFELLDARYGRPVWQREVLRAFQTWTQFANINVVLVADGGLPLGSTGAVQGDARFGDVRIAAYPMPPEVVAVASPFDFLAGTWSGDVKLNSLLFADGSPYDLFTVMVHEAGHVLGLDHSDDPSSVMAEDYLGVRDGPSAADIIALRELYGAREPDAYDAAGPNDTRDAATRLGHDGAAGDLTTPDDIDWYRFRSSGHDREAVVRLRVAELGLLAARVSVHDEAGHVLASASAESPGGDLEIRLNGLRASEDYFIKVERAAGDAFGVGGYRLEISSDGDPHGPGGGPDAPGQGQAHDSSAAVINLQRHVHRTDARFDYAYRGSFGQVGEVDYYRFHSPHRRAGSANVMTVLVWAAEGAARPRVELFRADGSAVEAVVLVSENGTQVLQLAEADENAVYLLAVRNALPGGPGHYFLGIDFGTQTANLETLVDRQPVAEDGAEAGTLHVEESRLFHLVLSAETATGLTGGAVRLDVFDPQGNRVVTLTADPVEPASTSVFLPPGGYVFRASRIGSDASAGPVAWTLRGLGLSDPVGPQPRDVTLDPFAAPGDRPASGSGYWWQGGYHAFLAGATPSSPSPLGSPPSGTAAASAPQGSGGITPGTNNPGAGPSPAATGAPSASAEVAPAVVDTVFAAQAARVAQAVSGGVATLATALTSGPGRVVAGSYPLAAAGAAVPTTPDGSSPAVPAWGGATPPYLQRLTPAGEEPPPWLTPDSDRPSSSPAAEGPVSTGPGRLGVATRVHSAEPAPPDPFSEPAVLPAEVTATETFAGNNPANVVGVERVGEDEAERAGEPRPGYLRLIGTIAASLAIGLIGGGLFLLSGTPPWNRPHDSHEDK